MSDQTAPIAAEARPRLPHGVRLAHSEAHGGWVLLAPERVFKADAIAVEIIKRCTREATLAEIADDLANTFSPARVRAPGLSTNRMPPGVGLTNKGLAELVAAGLDHVQISIQDSVESSADHIAGYEGAFKRKRELAAEVVRLKLPLTLNAVMHR